ncbi:polysaccharide biosynthesis/export family protein [Roseobacter sinensis]|uniref:Polysaccharide export protein n=1 Tax=Roseobacter sinensis TaxID=2931391 RepID=A0ABT3BJQ8_9RHOB|nr:polysaccharide biosynthesis/export family protein [Roseobacter sp. WL0113]MCV3273810.1 polysaccharide export protein [Roseobacter sp. WL0113]
MKTLLAALFTLLFSVVAVSAQSNYRLQPGDTLAVEVLEDSLLNRSVLVLPDGSINFPFAGTITAAGRTVADVQRAIADGIAVNFASPPTVFVTVSSVQPVDPEVAAAATEETINVYFAGEVGTPGLRQVLAGSTFLQAFSQSGGLTNFAASKRIQLRRTDPRTNEHQVFEINYRAISNGGSFERDIVLQDGDVILVPERRLFE